MKLYNVPAGLITAALLLMLLVGCAPSPQITPSTTWPPSLSPTWTPKPPEPPAPTDVPTPDLLEYCTGWDCAIDGVVYDGEAPAGNEMEGVVVVFKHGSNCSPTRGEYEMATGPDGGFSFEAYVHDTDSFRFSVEVAGYEPALVSFGGFDCLFCSCPPVEIVLEPSGATLETP